MAQESCSVTDADFFDFDIYLHVSKGLIIIHSVSKQVNSVYPNSNHIAAREFGRGGMVISGRLSSIASCYEPH